jgi:hypothetical protein
MSPLSNLSYDEVDEIFPDREPSIVELQVRAAEVDKKREELAQDLLCQAKTKSGKQCTRNHLPDEIHCGLKAHETQMKEK